MLASIPKFSKTLIDCKQKFNTIYKQYKDDEIVNGILGNDHYECPFYKALDCWQHQSGNVMKHVNPFTNETEKIVGSLESHFFFNSVSNDEGSMKLMDKPLTPYEV